MSLFVSAHCKPNPHSLCSPSREGPQNEDRGAQPPPAAIGSFARVLRKKIRPGFPPPRGRAGKPGLLQRFVYYDPAVHCGFTGWAGTLAVTAGAVSDLIFTVERMRSSFSNWSTWSTVLVLSSESSTASANS